MLDAGAFVAAERGDRAANALLRVAERDGLELRSNGVVVAQVWRDSLGRQASLARLLRAVDVRPVDRRIGQTAGALMAQTRTSDAVDATVVAIAEPGDRIITSDPGDLRALVAASRRTIIVVPC